MVRHSVLRSLPTGLVWLCILCAILAAAKPLQEKRAGQPTSLSPVALNASAPISSTITSSSQTHQVQSTSTTSTELPQSSSPLPKDTEPALLSTDKATSGPIGDFCQQFVQVCYRIAQDGPGGEVTVSHSCERNGDKYSTSFTYSCYRGTERLTPRVLKAMGQAFHRPSFTTIEEGKVVTRVIEEISTDFETVTTRTTTSTGATTTRTTTTQTLDVDVQTVPSTRSTTTVISYTASETLTSTATQTTVATSTMTTTTATEVFLGNGQIPIYQATLDDTDELLRRAPSTFCLAFRIACQTECQRVNSREDVEICDSSKSPTYTMACICRNGKRETQHALEAIADDRKVISVTKTSTSTTLRTSTWTTTLPTGALTTRLVTRTNIVPTTSTSFTTTTTTFGETTLSTSISTTAATDTSTTTGTITTTTTTEVPTTTRIVVAPTGYVRAFDYTTGEVLGLLGYTGQTPNPQLIPLGSADDAWEAGVRRDPRTGLYQLSQSINNLATVAQYPNDEFPVFESGTPAYTLIRFRGTSYCGTNGSGAGPPDPTSAPCETYIFSPIALDPSPGATIETINLKPFYINPSGSVPANHSGVWGFYGPDKLLSHVADITTYQETYPNDSMRFVTLRFSFATI